MRREVVIASVVVLIAIWATLAFVMIGHPIATEPDRIDRTDEPVDHLAMQHEPIVSDLDEARGGHAPVDLVALETGEHLWPYYSSSPGTFEQRSSINLIVYGDSSMLVDVLVGEADWLEIDPEEEGDAGAGTYGADFEGSPDGDPLEWGHASGTDRFAYVEVDGSGLWLSEAEQLHDGDYYGTRYHLRLYDIPSEGEVVAIQAHYEYFDWFTLRHTVTSVERAQLKVESDLMDRLGDEHIWREHTGNDGVYDSDGWVTFVVLGLVATVFLGQVESLKARFNRQAEPNILTIVRERVTLYHLGLFTAMIAIILGVRLAGIALEQRGTVRIKWIAAMMYPFLSLGLPLAAYMLANRIERRMDAAVAASAGLATGIILDFSHIGITVLPIDVILYRTGLVLAIGFIAAGGAIHATSDKRMNGFVIAGIVLWMMLLVVMLFSVV